MSTLTRSSEMAPLPEVQPYSPEDIAGLLVGSFRFSRGHEDTQQSILVYLCRQKPEQFTDELLEAGILLATERAIKVYGNDNAHPFKNSFAIHGTCEEQAVREVEKQAKFLKDPNAWPGDIDVLAVGLLEADLKWIPAERVFEGRKPSPKPYRSNVVHFGLLGRPTGRPEFDAMFSAATNHLLSHFPDRQINIESIITEHLDNFPQDSTPIVQGLSSAAQ